MSSLKPFDFDWDLYEPGAWSTEYGGVEHSIEFILAPVASWESRTRLEMENEMLDRETGLVMSWQEFSEMPSLIAQLSALAVRGPRRLQYDFDRYELEYPAILVSWGLVEKALDWIWDTYRVRLANRAYRAACEGGLRELEGICKGVTERFDVWRQLFDIRQQLRETQGLASHPEASLEEMISARLPLTQHELFYVVEARGWNGWEKEAWLRFVGSADDARKEFANAARRADRESAEEKRAPSAKSNGKPSVEVPQRGSYFAADYAEALRKAFSADPARFRQRGRYAFKALRTAARIDASKERTVKRWLGYEGSAGGFEEFVARLYAVIDEVPPE